MIADARIFSDLKGCQVINSIARLGYMLEAGNKFPTQAQTVFFISCIQGDHWVHLPCLLMGIFAMPWITVSAGGGHPHWPSFAAVTK
jgi:hypothetical protein